MTSRERFETWFADHVVGAEITFPDFEDGEYVESDIYDSKLYLMLQAMWMGWQAAETDMAVQLANAESKCRELSSKAMELVCEASLVYSKYNDTQMPDRDLVDMQTLQEMHDLCKGDRPMTALNKQALKTENERMAQSLAERNGEPVEGLRQRISELEEIATDYGMKFQKAQDALKHQALLHKSQLEAAENNLIDSECHAAELEESLRDKQALLEALDNSLCELLPGTQYMDPPDGGNVTPLEQVRRMVADYRERIAELEAREVTLPEALNSYAGVKIYRPNDVIEAIRAAGIGVKGE